MKPPADHPEETLVHPDDPTNNEPTSIFSRPTYNLQVFYDGEAIGWLGRGSRGWAYHYPDQIDPRVLQLAWYPHKDKRYLTMTNAGWLSYYAGYAGYPAQMRNWGYAVAWKEIAVDDESVELQVVGTDYKLSQYSSSNTEVYCTNNYQPLQFKFVKMRFKPLPTSDWHPRSKSMPNMPGVPMASRLEREKTEALLIARAIEERSAQDGLSVKYTLGGKTATAKDFLVEPLLSNRLPSRPLEHPEQFAISWTTYRDVYQKAMDKDLSGYAKTLTDAKAATEAFWPTIANFGTGYNLLILRKITNNRLPELKNLFGKSWVGATLDPAHQQGRLYEIDFRIFESFGPVPNKPDAKVVRFNPATLTILVRSEDGSAKMEPVMIRVWDKSGKDERSGIYSRDQHSDGTWLYALQAAKTSATLYGIWLGHVYHWHIVTAAMQRTMCHTIPNGHPLDKLLQPQATDTLVDPKGVEPNARINYLISFDDVLLYGSPLGLINWKKIAPPSRIDTPEAYLKLTEIFATGRQFFDDDPKTELAANGLNQADFTQKEPWDCYPAAQNLLTIWGICERFVDRFVDLAYPNDLAVENDEELQWWMWASGDPRWGNIRGLPQMNNSVALKNVLTSLVFRVTIHGISRLNSSINPALSFVANFPSCLQQKEIPDPKFPPNTTELLKYLPNTGTIGDMLKFYFAFVFSTPYHPLIPAGGPKEDLYFDGGPADPRNQALIKYREEMRDFITKCQPDPPNTTQWPRCIET